MLKERIKVSEFFYLDELVAPEIYHKWGAKSIYFLDRSLIIGLVALRKMTDAPIYINNWGIGGARKYSGLRPKDCLVGSKFSQHKFGRAFDIRSKLYSPAELRAILDEYATFFVGNGLITGYELDTDTWTHIENRVWKVDPFIDDVVDAMINRSNINTANKMVQIPFWRAPKKVA